MKPVAMMLKAIHAQESKAAALREAQDVITKLYRIKLSNAAKRLESGLEETLTYLDFSSEHWQSSTLITSSSG